MGLLQSSCHREPYSLIEVWYGPCTLGTCGASTEFDLWQPTRIQIFQLPTQTFRSARYVPGCLMQLAYVFRGCYRFAQGCV